MSGREFFLRRYRELGWEHREPNLRQAIRINTQNAYRKKIVERLKSRGIELEEIPFAKNGYWVCKSKFSVGAAPEYLLGFYSIQEAAAQIPAALFQELAGKIVLDACAAPGGKTVQLADVMRNTGVIISLDVNRKRLTALTNQLERCHVTNTIVYEMDARYASELDVKFDRILVDAPCSGNFATDRNWFHRRTIEDVRRNAEVQREILTACQRVLKVDGEMVYSTCSLEPEENELNVDWAINTLGLQTEPINCFGQKGLTEVFGQKLDVSVENSMRIWPGTTQGFFVCKFKRRPRT
jgi:NOL1/NOP2/sun family putative RNA methylase